MQRKILDDISKKELDKWSDENWHGDIGKNCDFQLCKQRDFLPFKCKYCKKQFCLEHKDPEKHSCAEYFKELAITSKIKEENFLECPLCFAKFPIQPGADPNFEMERHFHEDCKKEQNSLRRMNKCHCKGCSNEAVSTCPSCSKMYCLDHRIENDHACPKFQMKAAASSTSTSSASSSEKPKKSSSAMPSGLTGRDVIEFYKLKKQNKLLSDLNAEREQRNQNSSKPNNELSINASNLPKKNNSPAAENEEKILSKAKYQKLKAKYFSDKFQNLQTEPRGNTNVEPEDRFYADVYFPLFSKKKPIHMFFSKKWKIGVVLDKIANEGGIVNENNIYSKEDIENQSKRLNLFHLNTGFPLPYDKTIEEYQQIFNAQQTKNSEKFVFTNYEPLLLEYGESLRPEMNDIISKFKNSSLSANTYSLFSPTTLEEIKSCIIG